MAYPRKHDWEHCIRDTSRAKRRVLARDGMIGRERPVIYRADEVLLLPDVGSEVEGRKYLDD